MAIRGEGNDSGWGLPGLNAGNTYREMQASNVRWQQWPTCHAMLGLMLSLFFFLNVSVTYGQIPQDEQYKKRPTNAIAAIAQGNPDEAIENLTSYLADYPQDAESHYCLAAAFSMKNQAVKSLEHMKAACELGMPVERFLAGPRDLLKNLTQSDEFEAFVRGKYVELIHGPLLGDITAEGVKIWLRTASASDVQIDLRNEEGTVVASESSKTSSSGDFACITQFSGLQESSNYRYSISIDGANLFNEGTFSTLPKVGPSRFKLGFGGGAGFTPWYERMWDTLRMQSFDAFLMMGDNVYIDYPEVPQAQQYCYYRRQSRPEYRRFAAEVPLYSIWDDHDFTVNDGEGGPEIEIPVWKRPVWELFKEQWPNPHYGGGEEHPGCWFDFAIGDVDFFMLDCRYYREDPQMVADPSMLGMYQKEWLQEKLLNSSATFKVIASSVPWAKGTKPGSDDTWDGFDQERNEIFTFITENQIEGIVLISADRHRSDAWKVPLPGGYTTYDLMSSRLTNIHTHNLMEGSLFGYNKKCSFGVLEFDTAAEDPQLIYTIKSIDNEVIHRMTIWRSQLDYQPDKVVNKKGRK